MAQLQPMPPLVIPTEELKVFGDKWTANGGNLKGEPPSAVFDNAVGIALAEMLGGISIEKPKSTSLGPPKVDCVEVGPVRIVGGVRPQNFDVGYRPDGVRFAFDSKTLNEKESVGKNYQNMINDLGTEAVTVHSRFPWALVAFIVAIPTPCLVSPHLENLMGVLEHRLSGRVLVTDPLQQAEAISLVIWDPATGAIDATTPDADSRLRVERFSEIVEEAYVSRYVAMPPHN